MNLRILVLLLWFPLSSVFSADSSGDANKSAAGTRGISDKLTSAASVNGGVENANDLILLERSSRGLAPVVAAPDESTITRLTAELLARSHYLHHRVDDEISSKFLDRYIETLDGFHMYFLQSDLKEFDHYRDELDDLIMQGKTRPAREIFARFRQRLDQRVEFVAGLLKTEKFEFTGDDRYTPDRRHATNPKNLDDAKQLWRQHLRYEYLDEKLSLKKPALLGKEKPPNDENAKPDSAEKAAAQNPEAGIVKNIARRYARTLRFWREFDGDDVFQTYLTSLTHVYDPHSDYFGKASLENFAINMNLSLFGIGALLQSEDGYCKILELKSGPAKQSNKLKPGDRIVGVAQGDGEFVDVVDMKLSKVVDMIRGPKGTKVRLQIIPVDATNPSDRKQIALVRDEIKLEDEEAKAKVIEEEGKDGKGTRLGVIDLPSFYANFDVAGGDGKSPLKSTTLDVARLLKKLRAEDVAGIILDLRRNGGGSLEEAINLTGLFIKEGPVVQVRDSTGNIVVDEDTDPEVLYDGPLIVLTSRFSASASEILAGALQDYGRALIVGDTSTHGKGTVQSLVQLEPYVSRIAHGTTNNPGALKITVRKFYRASGSSTQLKGVVPDIILPSVNNYAEIGEGSLENPLPWDTIMPAKYDRLNRIQPVLPELRKLSEARVAADKDFDYVRQDIEEFKKYLADKSVSLNEAQRRQEQKEKEERARARNEERKSRHEPEEKIYDLTLKQVDLPGLPPPVAKTNDVARIEGQPDVAKAGDIDETEPDDKLPPVDVDLKEAKRILLDLIATSARETAVVGNEGARSLVPTEAR